MEGNDDGLARKYSTWHAGADGLVVGRWLRIDARSDGGSDGPEHRGLVPVGTVKLTETFLGGVGAGKGELTYHGKKYPFELIGTILGPGEAVSKTEVAGDVYKLDDISQFPGFYAQGSGQVGIETAGASELWLESKAGVIMHLKGTSSGATLGLGGDEVIIRMSR
jgi:hypothetical protein